MKDAKPDGAIALHVPAEVLKLGDPPPMPLRRAAIFLAHAGCPHRCSFCDQHRISGSKGIPSVEEMRALVSCQLEDLPVDSPFEVAFFGGSFTALPESVQDECLDAVADWNGRPGMAGIRVSTRPDAISRERLNVLRRKGVHAVELGAQSLNDRVLFHNRRGHTAKQVETAMALLQEAGFSTGIQTLPGLPGEDEESAMETAHRVIAMKPDVVRIYPAIVLPGTALADWLEEGRYVPLTLEQGVQLAAELAEQYSKAGIPVIRMGLQASEGLSQGTPLAGPWHPAFGELVLAERTLRRILRWLSSQTLHNPTELHLHVPANRVSRVAGHGIPHRLKQTCGLAAVHIHQEEPI